MFQSGHIIGSIDRLTVGALYLSRDKSEKRQRTTMVDDRDRAVVQHEMSLFQYGVTIDKYC